MSSIITTSLFLCFSLCHCVVIYFSLWFPQLVPDPDRSFILAWFSRLPATTFLLVAAWIRTLSLTDTLDRPESASKRVHMCMFRSEQKDMASQNWQGKRDGEKEQLDAFTCKGALGKAGRQTNDDKRVYVRYYVYFRVAQSMCTVSAGNKSGLRSFLHLISSLHSQWLGIPHG